MVRFTLNAGGQGSPAQHEALARQVAARCSGAMTEGSLRELGVPIGTRRQMLDRFYTIRLQCPAICAAPRVWDLVRFWMVNKALARSHCGKWHSNTIGIGTCVHCVSVLAQKETLCVCFPSVCGFVRWKECSVLPITGLAHSRSSKEGGGGSMLS